MTNEELKQLVRKIYEDAYLMSLGVYDGAGVWVSDVTYVFDDDLNLYWLSMPDVRHSVAIEKNSNVACTIHADWRDNQERALQIAGVAEKIEGPLFEMEMKLKIKTGGNIPSEPGEILRKGHVWYQLAPKKVELIHSEQFGKNKQSIDVSK
jgi:hypothetical protein